MGADSVAESSDEGEQRPIQSRASYYYLFEQ